MILDRRTFIATGATAAVLPHSGLQSPDAPMLSFPGAVGWAARTPAGRGGRILRVTNLESRGPGSLREALEAEGPRIVVFEVGGVIDLEREVLTIREPYVTVAGQTAPSPGVTLIRGGLAIESHDVVIRHIAVRPGEAGAGKRSGWEIDGIATLGSAHDVIVDHCSCTWATDENLSASGPRHTGANPDEWRRNTSRRITFSNNIIAECLSQSTHSKGEHSKGTLIHDNVNDVLITGNLYASNAERNPLVKGGARVVIANNLICNPGRRGSHYNLLAHEWRENPHQDGWISQVGNVIRAGSSSPDGLALMLVGGAGRLLLHQADNIALSRDGAPLPAVGTYTNPSPAYHGQPSTVQVEMTDRPPIWPPDFEAVPASEVQERVLMNAGARPWDRDAIDQRIVRNAATGDGVLIDSEQEVGGYPDHTPSYRPFDAEQWSLDDLTPVS